MKALALLCTNECASEYLLFKKRIELWQPADTKYEYDSLHITKYCKTLSEQPAQNTFE